MEGVEEADGVENVGCGSARLARVWTRSAHSGRGFHMGFAEGCGKRGKVGAGDGMEGGVFQLS